MISLPSYHVQKKMRLLIVGLTFLLSFSGCGKKSASKCDVLVSVPPYLYFVDILTDGDLRAASIVPAGANPHLYEPSPKQVAKAAAAKVWIRIGESFEKKIAASLEEQNPRLLTLDLSEELPLPPLPGSNGRCKCGRVHEKESKDLHFWLSLRLGSAQASMIAELLIRAFPERTEQINGNLAALQKEMERVDSFITERMRARSGEAVLVSHPAFGYFCYDYDLKQISVESEGKDPLPKEISSVLQLVKSSRVATILVQAQYNNKGALVIADKLNLKAREVDPYSSDYLNNFLYLAECIDAP